MIEKLITEPSAEEQAAIGYTEYSIAVGGVAFNGDPLPDWTTFRADESKKKQSDAWVAAATKILASVGYINEPDALDV